MDFKRYVGDKRFYKHVLAVALPIAVQNAITSFVGMLDNLMIGQLGTEQMTGVSVANQLIFVFNLCIFGAQFFGSGNDKGLRDTFRFKMIASLLLTALGVIVFLTAGPSLINAFLQGEKGQFDPAATLGYGREYLSYMMFGMLPFAFASCYSGTLRETEQTVVPMVSGIAAVLVNLVFNYILIFGHFGAPKLGVAGAAIATVISRFAELATVAVYTHVNHAKNPFIRGAYRSLRIPRALTLGIITKSLPLMFNEMMWSLGCTVLNLCYSMRGLHVVAATNINQTFWNVFAIAVMAMGAAISIILGQKLGAGETDGAADTARKLTAFSVFVSAFFAAAFFFTARYIPLLYNTEEVVRETATGIMMITAAFIPVDAYAHAAYFTMRSGGKMLITVLFDSGFVWLIQVPLAYALTVFTPLSIYWTYGLSTGVCLLKCVLGYVFVRSGSWVRNLVRED